MGEPFVAHLTPQCRFEIGETLFVPQGFGDAHDVRNQLINSAPGVQRAIAHMAVYAYQETRPDYPPTGVNEHLDSLHDLVSGMVGRGEIGLLAELNMRAFIDLHDNGYAVNADQLQERRDEHVAAIAMVGEALGDDNGLARMHAGQVVDLLVTHQNNYLISKILGHGVLGLLGTTNRFQAGGASRAEAEGMALLFASHHIGYPIDFVAGFSGDAIPVELRQRMLISDPGDSKQFLRRKVIEAGRSTLDIPYWEAKQVAVLGYALDRITAGRAPEVIDFGTEGELVVRGGEILQKKFSLIAKDLILQSNALEGLGLPDVLNTSLSRVRVESDHARKVAEVFDLPTYAQAITHFADVEQARTAKIHQDCIELIESLRDAGFSGAFVDIEQDEAWIKEHPEVLETFTGRYVAASLQAVKDTVLAATNQN